MRNYLIITLFVISSVAATAQDWGIKFNGFAKTDVMLDTRQTTAFREGHFYLFPSGEKKSADGEDLNEGLSLHMLSIQTRITGKITAPDFLGAKSTGLIEGEFFGTSDNDMNGFRLRHAYVDLNWGESILRIGQYWHPLFIDDAFPKTIAFNTGAPYQPFARNPQIKYTLVPDNSFEISAALIGERDFSSVGPTYTGPSNEYLRSSAIPMANLGLKYKSSSVIIAGNANYKSLRPRIATTKNIKTDEKVNSIIANALIKVMPSDDFYFTVQGLYGQNAYDMTMLGGYVSTIVDTAKGLEEYKPLNMFSTWLDMQYGKELSVGLFVGYSANLGISEEVKIANIYARGGDVDNLLRISPRIAYKEGNVQLAAELDYSQAAYGTTNMTNGKVENTKNINNIRMLLAAYIFF